MQGVLVKPEMKKKPRHGEKGFSEQGEEGMQVIRDFLKGSEDIRGEEAFNFETDGFCLTGVCRKARPQTDFV